MPRGHVDARQLGHLEAPRPSLRFRERFSTSGDEVEEHQVAEVLLHAPWNSFPVVPLAASRKHQRLAFSQLERREAVLGVVLDPSFPVLTDIAVCLGPWPDLAHMHGPRARLLDTVVERPFG